MNNIEELSEKEMKKLLREQAKAERETERLMRERAKKLKAWEKQQDFLNAPRSLIIVTAGDKVLARAQGLSKLVVESMTKFARYWAKSRWAIVNIATTPLDHFWSPIGEVQYSEVVG